MGLLDDAIREHLDLKRRRGADPAEIERAEREALGPVRREPEEAAAVAEPPEHPIPTAEEVAYASAEPAYDEPGGYEDKAAYAVGTGYPEDTAYEEEVAYEEDVGYDEEEFEDDEEISWHDTGAHAPVAPAPVSSEPRGARHPDTPIEHQPPAHAGDETVEYDVERAFAEEERAQPAEREDVLEETPEFLQDTPDHDRLWFEQRPPRDFDFDG